MSMIQMLLKEMDNEATTTRKMLERVPIPGSYGPSADEMTF